MTSIAIEPTARDIAGAGWQCCADWRPMSDGDRKAAEYGGWTGIYPRPKCERCGQPMLIVIQVTRPPAPPKEEPATHLLTKTQIRERMARAKALEKQIAEAPERTLMPWGDHVGKPMDEVPKPDLEKCAQYYSAGRRKHLTRSKEIVRAAQAAIAARTRRMEEDVLAVLQEDDDNDGLNFTEG